MDINILELEKNLKENSKNSTEELIRYALFEIQSPIEDYFFAIDLLTESYSESRDIRVAILGAYLSSTWLSFKENAFLELLDEHFEEADNQNRAIICYLHAYDIYMKVDEKYPPEYFDYLKKSISYSERFVYNYIRFSEVTYRDEACELLEQALSNIEVVWNEEQIKEMSLDDFLEYENFINEFILGVDISIFEYEGLLARREAL